MNKSVRASVALSGVMIVGLLASSAFGGTSVKKISDDNSLEGTGAGLVNTPPVGTPPLNTPPTPPFNTPPFNTPPVITPPGPPSRC